jgi:hypothetical protein
MTMMGCFSVAGRPFRSATGAAVAAKATGDAALPALADSTPLARPAGKEAAHR